MNINIIVNGEKKQCQKNTAILDYLKKTGYSPETIIIELNREILKTKNWNTKKIHEGDIIEIVSFVGGG
jgi:sulfur carrier protein